MTITGARYEGQVQAEGESYYTIPVVSGTKYLIKVTQKEVRGTWRFHFYVYDDGIHGRKLASAGYINGNEYKSALIESFTGESLYLEVLSYGRGLRQRLHHRNPGSGTSWRPSSRLNHRRAHCGSTVSGIRPQSGTRRGPARRTLMPPTSSVNGLNQSGI